MLSKLTKAAVIVSLVALPVVTTAATINASRLLTHKIGASKTIIWANKTVFKKLVKFKKAVRVLGTLTTNNLHVTGTATFDTPLSADQVETAAVTADDVTTVTTDNVQTGFVQYKVIQGDALQALLDGNANSAMSFSENDVVFDIIYAATGKAAAGSLDIGVDANWSNLAVDGAGFFNNIDLTSSGITRMITADEASQTTLGMGAAVVSTTGDLTVQSSADLTTDTSFDGKLIVAYIRN